MRKHYIIPAVTAVLVYTVSCLCSSGTGSDNLDVGNHGEDQSGARGPHRTAVF